MKIEIDQIWEAILQLKNALKSLSEPFQFAVVAFEPNKIGIYINEFEITDEEFPSIVIADQPFQHLNGLHSRFSFKGLMEVNLHTSGKFETEQITFIQQYLPYACLPVVAKKTSKTITISHFAQSLDGRIATDCGNSQWIGNDENLTHAHRMRALCDGILIGSNTLINDNPSLTVRKVKGENPVKIVVGNSKNLNFSKLTKDDARVIHVTSNGNSNASPSIDIMDPEECNGQINCEEMLKKLYLKGINTVYIEGGSKTASVFLEQGLIDIVQLHIAPMIMGSGIPNFTLPVINDINQSVTFVNHQFHVMGDHIMFTGEVDKHKS